MLKLNKFLGFSLSLVKRFTLQILNGLNFLEALEIIHCDLKPENILLKYPNKSDIVLIDFGSATFSNEKQHTYIQSRFYRAPEIILGIPYTTSIDMWSLGCILSELHTGKPLLPGESEHDQLVLIIELFGNPSVTVLQQSIKREMFFENKVLKDPTVNNIVKVPGSKKLYEVICCADELFLDFITKCLEIDPDLRLTPQAALKHPWLAGKQKTHNLSYLEKKNKYKLKF